MSKRSTAKTSKSKKRLRNTKEQTFQSKFWRDKDGKIAIYQRPNWLIVSWLFVSLAYWANLYTPLNRAFFGIGTLLLAAWSLLELVQGVSYFRRALGGIIFLLVLASLGQVWQIVF